MEWEGRELATWTGILYHQGAWQEGDGELRSHRREHVCDWGREEKWKRLLLVPQDIASS